MKKIIINRKNDYVAAITTINVKVNDEPYKLYSGTKLNINIESDCKEVVVEINYLLFWRKYVYKTDSSELIITISPTVSNQLLIFSMVIFFYLLFFYLSTQLEIGEYLFKIYGITLIAMFFFISTIGGKYFYKANLI